MSPPPMFDPTYGQVDAGEALHELDTALGPLGGQLLRYAVWLLVAVVVLYVVWKLLARRRKRPLRIEPDLTIDVASLGDEGPPPQGPVLEHYNLPTRLAAVVVAPAGRAGRLPPPDQLADVFEAVVPGLSRVVAGHRAMVRVWPEQLSTSGFAHSFFRHVRLPGDGGKGTVWSSAAGVAKLRGQAVMVGLVMRSDSPNSLGQTVVERETKWLDVLRVKPAR